MHLAVFCFYTFVVSLAFMAGAANQAGDADSSRAPVLISGLQGSVNVHRDALLLVPQRQCISSYVFYIVLCLHCMKGTGWSSGNNLAYHSSDPCSIPSPAIFRKSMRVSEVNFHLPPAIHHVRYGVYKRDWWRRANYLCLHCFLWPGTIFKEVMEAQPWTSNYTPFNNSPHICVPKWREDTTRRYVPNNRRGYEAFSLKLVGLMIKLEYGRWSMSPSNK